MLLHPSNLFTYKSVSNNARLGELPFALVGFEVKSSGSCDNVQYSLTDRKPTGTEDEKLQYVLICGQQSTLMLATGGHDAQQLVWPRSLLLTLHGARETIHCLLREQGVERQDLSFSQVHAPHRTVIDTPVIDTCIAQLEKRGPMSCVDALLEDSDDELFGPDDLEPSLAESQVCAHVVSISSYREAIAGEQFVTTFLFEPVIKC